VSLLKPIKRLTTTKALAYYAIELIRAVKSFKSQTPGTVLSKLFCGRLKLHFVISKSVCHIVQTLPP
jgi:hypothetical protein